ncbi:MAG TPA: L-2-hydroxyglutarate oxidase, partial [Pilimelia sp.]|nr:L-2-hydroxyglutarate oxidase [Pilimelia sp.]
MRYAVIGGGIIGLAVAHRITLDRPGARVTVLEKERRLAAHQTGHNSGVIHAGVYYPPGSLKARLCQAGSRSMVDFCREYGLPVEVCGKLIAATAPDELPRLRALHDRAVAGGLPVRLVDGAQAREYEPHLSCLAAMHVASTGIVDFAAVAAMLATLAEQAGATIRLGARVTAIAERATELVVGTTAGEVVADVLVNCAGLHADRVARLAGVRPSARIVPFRGEYLALRPERRDLVRGLIYPVPDPALPFLGVHLTRVVDGSVHAGPNAVLALAREGYSWRRVNPRDVAGMVAYPGMWRLGRRHL